MDRNQQRNQQREVTNGWKPTQDKCATFTHKANHMVAPLPALAECDCCGPQPNTQWDSRCRPRGDESLCRFHAKAWPCAYSHASTFTPSCRSVEYFHVGNRIPKHRIAVLKSEFKPNAAIGRWQKGRLLRQPLPCKPGFQNVPTKRFVRPVSATLLDLPKRPLQLQRHDLNIC